MLSKGSNQRPSDVPKEQYDRNWDRIFRASKKAQDDLDRYTYPDGSIFSKSVKESDKKREKNGNVR